jgi:hypothetical protein
VSEVIDATFTEAERNKLLTEVRAHLPAFLLRSASEQHDPVGDVSDLLGLEPDDLARVINVHRCLEPAVIAFGDELQTALRRPVTSSTRPPEATQSVRGPIDWAATVRRRALEAGNPALFVVRPARRIFDTPENRAVVWLIHQLASATRAAGASVEPEAEADAEAASWYARITRLAGQLQQAQRVQWLRQVPAERPRAQTLKRLQASRLAFYARTVVDAIRTLERLDSPTGEQVTELLTQRYFRPQETWRLFEVAVALRLARAFAARSPHPRRSRLLAGGRSRTFARYTLADGDEIQLIYQGWPSAAGRSLRSEAGQRHSFQPGASRPDLFIARVGAKPDLAILELKATYSPGYLGSGLSQLLGYLGERPDGWVRDPSGWLVAPASAVFAAADASSEPLWVVSAEEVADAAVERFAGPAVAVAA